MCDSTVYDSAIHPQNVRGPPRALAARPTVAHVVAGGPVNRPPYVTAAVVETCARNSQSTKKRAFRQRTPEDTLYPHSDREDAFSRARPPPWSASNPARRHSTRNAPRNDRTAQRRHGAVGGNHPRRKRSILAARQGRLPAGGVARTPPAGRFSPAARAPGAHSLLDFTYHLPGIHILELNKAARRRGGGARGPKSLLWRNLGAYTCIPAL